MRFENSIETKRIKEHKYLIWFGENCQREGLSRYSFDNWDLKALLKKNSCIPIVLKNMVFDHGKERQYLRKTEHWDLKVLLAFIKPDT